MWSCIPRFDPAPRTPVARGPLRADLAARAMSASASADSEPPAVALPGRLLLDPEHAQHLDVVRTRSYLSEDEMKAIENCASSHRSTHPDDGFATLYLQRDGHAAAALAPVLSRIDQLVRRIDTQRWGLNAEADLEGVSGLDEDASTVSEVMNARTIEFHEYSARGRHTCGNHVDTGSLFTADVMLSDTNDFEGGEMTTTVISENGTAATETHRFERGDCLVFPSHKAHSVGRVRSGARKVFVVEFWRGVACTCNCRCMGSCALQERRELDVPAGLDAEIAVA